MTSIDWLVIIVYLLAMVGLSVYVGRGQKDEDDYYVAGRTLPWFAVAVSTMSTQTSNNSFVGIPAYVALKSGGGLNWLQYELALPLAIIIVSMFLLPFFRRLELVSVYEYLERRFNTPTRLVLSAVFLVSRGLGTGAGLYGAAVVMSVCFGLSIPWTIVLLGLVVVIYDTIGGIAAVVWSDLIQFFVILAGIALCIWFAVEQAGGVEQVLTALPAERWATIDPSLGIGAGPDGEPAPGFWAFLFGGLVLYVSYYGVDQSQVQRELGANSVASTKRSLLFNGLMRFPLTLLYISLGVAVYGAYVNNIELKNVIDVAIEQSGGNQNLFLPIYIQESLPVGLRALVFSAIMAAAMSSLDSSLNSLSAVTMRDFLDRILVPETGRLRISKGVTVIWGGLITAAAVMISRLEGFSTLVEIVNKIGSAFYGPIAVAFLLGVLSRRITGAGVIAGVSVGVGVNVFLWLAPMLDDMLADANGTTWLATIALHFMWWNVTGALTTLVIAYAVSWSMRPPEHAAIEAYVLTGSATLKDERRWWHHYAILAGYFLLMLALLVVMMRLVPN